MRVFVAGATGVLGRALLPLLKAEGHEVLGLARTPEKLLLADRLGAQAVRGDVLDAPGMQRLFQEMQPEAVVNLATAIPLKLRIQLKDWEMNDRVRREGTANLLRAAEAGDTRLFVQESVGYVCQPQGAAWLEEDAPRSMHPFLQATIAMEDRVRESALPAVLLRFGALMSADAWHTQQSITALRRGLLPIIGDGDSYVSQIHVMDAVQAIALCLANPEASAGQTFHVADDAPALMKEVLPYAAQLFQAPPPRRVPVLMAKIIAGALTLEVLTASYRMRNAHIKRALNFAPRYPTYRESWTQIAQEVGGRDFTPSPDLK